MSGGARMDRARPVSRPARAALLFIAACSWSCGPSRPPQWIADVEGLASGPATAGVMQKAPAEWKAAKDALEDAGKALGGGHEEEAKRHAAKASILFKTAMTVARGKDAKERIDAACKRASAAIAEAEALRSKRLDAQARFLSLQSFHESQGDLAKQKLASLEKDKKALAAMSESQKEKWLALEATRLDREIQRSRATILTAQALGCDGSLPAESGETAAALAKAAAAPASLWESRRTLVDDAALRADRFLHHCRALHEPDPIENPAGDAVTVAVLVKALEGTGAVVSAGQRGIVVAIPDPQDGQGGLGESATSALGIAGGVVAKMTPAVVLVEVYPPAGCSGESCAADALELAGTGAAAFVAGAAGVTAKAHGWGPVPPSEPGPCLSACPGGRLDVVVLLLD